MSARKRTDKAHRENFRAAQRYSENVQESHDEDPARDAGPAPESPEQVKELKRAEKKGRRKARELDPNEHRDRTKPERG